MRGAFGLASVLVTALLVAWLWAEHTAQVASTAKKIKPEVSQMAGRNVDQTPAADSITLSSVENQPGTLSGLKVDSIIQGCAFEQFYGLQQGDVIKEVGPFTVGSTTIDTVESGKDMMVDALENKRDLLVDRGGQQIHLPAQRDTPATPAAANPTAAQTPPAGTTPPSSPVTAPPPPRNAQGQTLDLLNKIGAREKNQDQQ
jgi:hypothetical protein